MGYLSPKDLDKLKRICNLYARTKELMLYAEEIDPEFNSFIQPVNELRHAFDHLMRISAVRLEIRNNPGEGYVGEQLDRVLGHVYRGTYDTLDKISITFREKIIKETKPFSVDTIQVVIPKYYSEIRPNIENINEEIAKLRVNKDVISLQNKDIEQYIYLIEQLKKYYELVLNRISILVEYEEKIKEKILNERRERENLKLCGLNKKVFIMHGHDLGVKEMVARFLEKIELNPIILEEESDEGDTIIEKLERCASDVEFAIALLTPDDVGALKSNSENLKDRVRQNVILELGYFTGKIGRKRICILNKDVEEIPSDYQGILYIPLDGKESWKISLAKQLKSAGFKINLDKIL